MPTTKDQIRASLAAAPRTTGKVLKRSVESSSMGKQVVRTGGKTVGRSQGKAVVVAGKDQASLSAGKHLKPKGIAKTKPTKREQYRKWERNVLSLSDVDPRKVMPFSVLHRKIKKQVMESSSDVVHVSSEYTALLHEALLGYLHKFYENGYTTTVKCGKRTTLMVRDLHAVYQAMGDTVVEPKREASDVVDAADE